MVRFIIRRLLAGVVLLLAISTLSYMLLYMGSGNIARTILGQSATEDTVAKKAAELGLDQPLLPRYLDWLQGAVHGDFGRSWFTSQPVAEAISSRLAVTLSLVIGTVILSAIIAVAMGVWAARKGGIADRIIQVVAILGFAIPNFLIAIFLVRFFALQLGWFKPTGYVQIGDSFTGWLGTVTLPIIALSVGAVAAVAQQVRGSVIDAMRQDWVRTLRSRGIPESRVVYKHVLRNAGGPALAVLAVQFVGLVGGAVIVEQIFAIPGLGQVSVTATSQGDIPLVMGLVVAVGIVVVLVNLLFDVLQGFLNPKVRLS
ncbi:ABC transporter permease [Demequina capsici]|uniref:ABC transporter permease n=1 Tax=Demequina capsici TaxID=3075620 RepID=A0AA96J9P8_9MICO|nr:MULTISPECIES: ABC transporter permease [unclassified Demequina]WNM24658.1 ABC transporter permease [Demequina sp. OYTSA14]WNM27507.1 ABC transporter permease [Demequina sp. PMTSA13]